MERSRLRVLAEEERARVRVVRVVVVVGAAVVEGLLISE